jgi:hypothetical protein
MFKVLVIVMCGYAVEQCVLLCEFMLTFGSAAVLEKAMSILPGLQFQAQQAYIILLIMSSLLGHLWTRKVQKKVCLPKIK